VRESIALAFGLALNNLGAGIGSGISELNSIVTTAAVVVLSLLSISGGYSLGLRFATRMPGVWAGILSGGLLAFTGVYEYFVLP
jgi:putative Mn2+ efflux pump MntP